MEDSGSVFLAAEFCRQGCHVQKHVCVVPRNVGLLFRPGRRVSASKNVLTRLWCLAPRLCEGGASARARGPLLFDASTKGSFFPSDWDCGSGLGVVSLQGTQAVMGRARASTYRRAAGRRLCILLFCGEYRYKVSFMSRVLIVLAVRMSRCDRNNPGSTPREDMHAMSCL